MTDRSRRGRREKLTEGVLWGGFVLLFVLIVDGLSLWFRDGFGRVIETWGLAVAIFELCFNLFISLGSVLIIIWLPLLFVKEVGTEWNSFKGRMEKLEESVAAARKARVLGRIASVSALVIPLVWPPGVLSESASHLLSLSMALVLVLGLILSSRDDALKKFGWSAGSLLLMVIGGTLWLRVGPSGFWQSLKDAPVWLGGLSVVDLILILVPVFLFILGALLPSIVVGLAQSET